MTQQTLRQRRAEILRLAAKHGARNVRVFGSVARDDAGPRSDLDLLVDMEPGRSLLDIGALMTELQDLLGCGVDIVTGSSIYWILRRRIVRESLPL